MTTYDLIESLALVKKTESDLVSVSGRVATAQSTAESAQGAANTAQSTANAADSKAQQALDRPIPKPDPDVAQSAWNAIGAYILAKVSGFVTPNTVVSGASLLATSCLGVGTGVVSVGTWRSAGVSSSGGNAPEAQKATIWQRIA